VATLARSCVPARKPQSLRNSSGAGSHSRHRRMCADHTHAVCRARRQVTGKSSAATCPLVKRGTVREYAGAHTGCPPGSNAVLARPPQHDSAAIDTADLVTFDHPLLACLTAVWARDVGVVGFEGTGRTVPTSIAAVLRGPRGNAEAPCRTFVHSCGQVCGHLSRQVAAQSLIRLSVPPADSPVGRG
jgi:hypothetical protein